MKLQLPPISAHAPGFILFLSFTISSFAQTNLPVLQIVSSNNIATVSWPDSAYYFLLQSKPELSTNSIWTNEAGAAVPVVANTFPGFDDGLAVLTTNVAGNNFAFNLPATNVSKFFQLKTPFYLPLSFFEVFYNGALEFSGAPAMTLNGQVHANGPIYLGSSGGVTFNLPATTTSTVSSPMVDGFGPWTPTNWNVTFNGNPNYITNIATLNLFTGTNNPHALIETPSVGEDPSSEMGRQRLYNEAAMILLVTNDASGFNANPTVNLVLQISVGGMVPGSDPARLFWTVTNASTARLATNFPFLILNNSFYDQRERKTNIITDINMDNFAAWISTNSRVQFKLPARSDIYPAIFYLADQRTRPGRLAVVRLYNAGRLPANNGLGFTVATQNPLYLWGNYNVQLTSGGPQSVSTTNTSYTVPAAIFCDALTILSSFWSDADSASPSSPYSQGNAAYDASDTTVNAAIITGTVPSTGTNDTSFSGGIQNLPRLLEDWSAKNFWLNTSLIRPWDSQMATNQFRNPAGFNPAPVNPYYNPPTRHFNFDPNFLQPTKIPPGIPIVSVSWSTNQ